VTRFQPLPECGGAVAAAAIAPLAGVPAHAADLDAARRLPAWRVPEHLAARTLLRRLVGEVVDAAAAASPLAARARGQPYLVERPDVGVSLSHTDGWVAAAVHTGGAVGVDAQAPVRAGDGLLRRCCTPTALAALARLPDAARDVEFAWIWSVQEACVKATGTGIGGLPWRIPVEVGQRTGSWRNVGWSTLRDVWPVPVSCAIEAGPWAG
jgi:4'-phosphopantetheinyl transferase